MPNNWVKPMGIPLALHSRCLPTPFGVGMRNLEAGTSSRLARGDHFEIQ
jgi:hypothetical protein